MIAGGAYANTLPTSLPLLLRSTLSSFLPIQRAYVANVRTRPEDHEALERLLADGKVKPIVENVFPLSDAARAWATFEAGGVVGKVVLQAPEPRAALVETPL